MFHLLIVPFRGRLVARIFSFSWKATFQLVSQSVHWLVGLFVGLSVGASVSLSQSRLKGVLNIFKKLKILKISLAYISTC